jgi:peptide/nickel transport system substrate-binding protein
LVTRDGKEYYPALMTRKRVVAQRVNPKEAEARAQMRSNLPLSALLAVIFVTLACGPAGRASNPPAGQPSAPASPQRALVVAIRGEPPSIAARPLVPFTAALNTPLFLFNATLDYRDERSVPHPYLAEGLPQLDSDTWRVLPDGRMETRYHFQPNLAWQDGTPFSAEDFVFAWRVYGMPQFGAATSPPIGLMEEVTAPDARTLVIRWKQPYPDAASFVQMPNSTSFQALPRHILQQPLQDLDPIAFSGLPFWTTEYVGLGPYQIDGWEPGSFLRGRAFDRFVFGRPKIDRIEVRFIPDPQTAVANLLASELDFVSDFVFSVTEGLTLEQQWVPSGGGTVLYSPISIRSSVIQQRPEVVDTSALLDVRVRQAIAFGIDSATAVEVLTAGKGVPTNTLTSPGVPYYAEIERVIQKHPYDPRRAQQLMEEAGYAKGSDGLFANPNSEAVRFNLTSSSGTKNESEAAAYVDSLHKAGFAVAQKVLPAAQLDDPETRALLPGLQVRGAGDNPVTYTSEQVPSAENRWRGENRGGWKSPDYDRVYAAYNSTLAEPERIRQLAELERIMTEQVPVIPHFFGVETTPFSSAISGPVARQAPPSSGAFLYSWKWEMKS